MATKESFTPEEWNTVFQSPLMAGMAVIFTARSGPLQAMLEMSAVARALATDTDSTDNGVVKAVRGAIKAGDKPANMREKPTSIEQARSDALEHLRQTATIVDAKAPEDAAGFKAWLSEISVKVAEAAKEGSFLGIGGTQVTDEERAAVADVAAALAVSAAPIDTPATSGTAPSSPSTPNFGGTPT